jgi:hypothetical protein
VSTEEAEQISIRFRKETTWSLCILTSPIISPSHKITQKPHPLSSEQGNLYQQVHKKPLNQQEALTYARELLSPLPGYRKIGIELQSRTLCAHFNFPDAAGEQHLALFLQVEAQTGWKVRINPSVRQEALANLALQLLPDVLVQHKTASIYQNQRIVRLRCKGNAATKDIEHAQQSFLQQTGWMVEYLNDGSREG